MDLRTASLLGERFLSSAGQGGVADKLKDVLEVGEQLVEASAKGSKPSDDVLKSLNGAAKTALFSFENSVFGDAAMKVFPEFEQLGFSSVLGSDIRDSLEWMVSAHEDDGKLSERLAHIGRQGEGMSELTAQVEKLMSVAEYFGVESRDEFDADAIAVIQMPDGEAGEHASGNVDDFVERMQSFQSIVEYCGVSDEEAGANIRMISGDDALVVADLSVDGAHTLQNMISDIKSAKADISEIENASERLEKVGVSQKIIDMLGEETGLIRSFDESKAGSFISSLMQGENAVTSKWMANAVMGLLDSGVRIDSVVIQPADSDAADDDVAVNTVEEGDVVETAPHAVDASDMTPKNDNGEIGDKSDNDESVVDQDSNTAVGSTAAFVAAAGAAIGATVDKTADSVESVTSAATDQVAEVVESVPSVVEEAKDVATETVDAVAGHTNGVIADVKEGVSDTVEKAEELIEDTKETISNGVSNGVEKVGCAVDESKEIVDTANDAATNAARARKKNLRSIWETFSGRS